MDENLLTYRIFRAFKKAVLEDPSFKKRLLSLAKPAESEERLKINSTMCIVDPEWVDMIEKKMPALVNAVAEERQFVRTEGEVLPIERVRSVSKDSIADLGKHANYLTHDPATTGGKVIPDRLMVSKKENDYAVYENRFLYTALVYLNQFLELRLNEIVAVTGRYEGESIMSKTLRSPTATLEFSVRLHETRMNDPVSSRQGGSAEAVRKISSFLATTRSLLDTPLMKEVSSAPMVKMPITKTNIIRFDPNFQGALELFLFLHAYDKKGYEIVTKENEITPFQGRTKEDFATLLFVDSYLTYVYGNDLVNELHLQSEQIDEKQKEEALAKYRLSLAKARREMDAHKEGREAYIAMMEEGEKLLEKTINEIQEELNDSKNAVRNEVKRLAAEFDKGLALQHEEFQAQVAGWEEKIKEAERQADERIALVRQECAEQIQEEKARFAEKEEEKQAVLREKEELMRQLEEEKELRSIAQAEIIAMQQRQGKSDFENMTSKEKFAYLDAQKKAFDAYYKKQWSLTKKAIMKEAFSAPDPKAKKKKKKGGEEE